MTTSHDNVLHEAGAAAAALARAGRARGAPALHRPARRRPRQGHPGPALRRHVRGGRRLLRRRDGDRPAAHAGRRRRGGVRRLRDQARPVDASAGSVAAGSRLVPRRGLDARRLRPLARLPSCAARARDRRLRAKRADADRGAGTGVLPARARPRRATVACGATSTSSRASTPSAPSRIRARSCCGCCCGATSSACRRSPPITSS